MGSIPLRVLWNNPYKEPREEGNRGEKSPA